MRDKDFHFKNINVLQGREMLWNRNQPDWPGDLLRSVGSYREDTEQGARVVDGRDTTLL